MKRSLYRRTVLPLWGLVALTASWTLRGGDWVNWRGPHRDGISHEKGLPSTWSADGDNLLWRALFGGISSPIVMNGRVYLQNGVGQGETVQERVVCLDADSGKLLWDYRFNVYMSDVPPHRIGWASPVGDPATDTVYVFGAGGTLLALSASGNALWERSLTEDFGLVTTHGGRTVSPIIEGDLVIVSGLSSGWGEMARGAHRFMGLDKSNGNTVWVSSPGGRPFDTTYSTPIGTVINDTRLIVGGAGDGSVHALMPQTGEPVWQFEMTKRGVNTGVVFKDNVAIVSHSEENLDDSEMGLIAAVDGSSKGALGRDHVRWSIKGILAGYASPVVDGDRVYHMDNGANLFAFDTRTGKELWRLNLGTIQRASPVLADGKLYVGTQNGKFFILKPGPDGCEILDDDFLGTEEVPEEIRGGVAVSDGRIFLTTSVATYSIGKKVVAPATPAESNSFRSPSGKTHHVQVAPTELVLAPGETVDVQACLYDDKGRRLPDKPVAWSLLGLKGQVSESGQFTASRENIGQAGKIQATVDGLAGSARIRVIPPLPWREDFESLEAVPGYWINATGKFETRVVEGNKVLVKKADNPFTKRARVFMGPSHWRDYTVQVDVLAKDIRRQMGDAGIVAQRYALVLFGNHQKIELESWQPETERTVRAPFSWKGDIWYRLKLEVATLEDGSVRVRGKAWPVSESEPAAWTLEKVDPLPNRQGSPGIYADARAEVFFDNLRIELNK